MLLSLRTNAVALVFLLGSGLGRRAREAHQHVNGAAHHGDYDSMSDASSSVLQHSQSSVRVGLLDSIRPLARILLAPHPVSAFHSLGNSRFSAFGLAKRCSQRSPTAVALAPKEDVAVILLAGGSGKRMGADRPKQFLELQGKPVLQHSLELLLNVKQLSTLVLVIAEDFRDMDFIAAAAKADARIRFADPGAERQDSVSNGLALVPESCTLVAVHDAARPLVTLDNVHTCLDDAATHGAAVLGVPMKATVKQSLDGEFVKQTLDRSTLWEIQTPQIIRPQLLRDGFEKVRAEGLEVTDDVSIVEQLGAPVKLTLGEYTNLKLTTPEDMVIAEQILEERR